MPGIKPNSNKGELKMETIKVSWYPTIETFVQELRYSGMDNAKASEFRRLSAEEEAEIAADYSAAYAERVSVFSGEREDSFTFSIRGKEFKGELFCVDRGYDSWTTALIAPSGRVFVRHFGDTAEMSAFLDAETK